MEKLLDTYAEPVRSGVEKELEVRFYADKRDFTRMLSVLTDPEVRTYVNIVGGEARIEKLFVDNKESKRTFSRKTKTADMMHKNAKIAVSFEEIIKDPSEQKKMMAGMTSPIYRIILRMSFVVPDLPGWRLDASCVFSTHESTESPKYRDKMFAPNPGRMEHIARLLEDNAIKSELELEWLSDKTRTAPTEEEVKSAIDTMQKMLGDTSVYDFRIVRNLLKTQKDTLKSMLAQPVELDFAAWDAVRKGRYLVSDKADGVRCMVYMNKNMVEIITDSEVMRYDRGDKDSNRTLILDAEFIKELGIVLWFDVLYDNELLTSRPMSERLKHGPPVIKFDGVNIAAKHTVAVTSELDIKKFYRTERDYKVDGLIFSEDASYEDAMVYKWKPTDQLTVDFFVVKTPKHLVGRPPYGKAKYVLMCGMDKQFAISFGVNLADYNDLMREYGINPMAHHIPVVFSPSFIPPDSAVITYDGPEDLDGKIAEFVFNVTKRRWVFVKHRPDKDEYLRSGKSFGNNHRTAESWYMRSYNPLTIDVFASDSKNGYFAKEKDEKYKDMLKYNIAVKRQLLTQVKSGSSVLDYCCGRGSDLASLVLQSPAKIYAVDNDIEALITYAKRKYELTNPKYYPRGASVPNRFPKIVIMRNDATKMDLDIPPVDFIIMNFAIHYLIPSDPAAAKFAKHIAKLLASHGLFIFTCFNGARLLDILEKSPTEEYGTKDGKFYIKLVRDKNKPAATIQDNEIDVKHHFSDELYREHLMDVDNLVKLFAKSGIVVRQKKSFADMANLDIRLTSEDRDYVKLYDCITLWKK
jgi:SAM-dependent methyltransferase